MTNKQVYLFKTSSGLELNILCFSCEFTYSVCESSGLVAAQIWSFTVEYVGVWVFMRNSVLWLCGWL